MTSVIAPPSLHSLSAELNVMGTNRLSLKKDIQASQRKAMQEAA
ncbi:MAG: hypothetical protein OQK66_07525 [Prosthecochloris sp.]|nr:MULTISPECIES: hypothetical protein [Prosthecochloris]MCW8798800.1 hypothetical protein [Prosthecochloris sp.]